MDDFKWKKYKGFPTTLVIKKDVGYCIWCLNNGYEFTKEQLIEIIKEIQDRSLPEIGQEIKKSSKKHEFFDESDNLEPYETAIYRYYKGKPVYYKDLSSNEQAEISNAHFKGYSLLRGEWID